ncbi:EF-P 5-aminopentanol modification-associated protein YfmF [Oceanobacillus halotolerans]|uniref:EF-P 5-aminopentanol modification-associated protein YfmF n=1 Tax=Oceanobacillus halotolerans TaxID=2663380 RepID=UPI0013DAFF11|nr:pitrilysin family protein [Oceanobacillus halotolerans]
MESVNEKIINEGNFRLHIVPTSKYKTINIVVKLKAPLSRDTITKRALLPYVLQQGTKNFPSRTDLQNKLDDLYGAVLAINGSKKGENHIISVRLEIANPKFIPNASNLKEEALQILQEIIFNPKTNGGSFEETIVEREKETLRHKIDSIIDEKMSYANMRLIDEMCKDEAYQLHVNGYKEDLDEINATSLYTYYQQILQEDQMDVYVLGDIDQKEIEQKLPTLLSKSRKGESAEETKTSSYQKKGEPKEVIEHQDVQQAKLHIGYRTNTIFSDNDYFALQVFNGLFGGFPSSKLFINVREKNSLAYYASSRLESHKGLLLVFSGIAPTDYEKAKDIIIEQMNAMKNGDFTENELEEIKGLIENQLLETMDHPQGFIELLYQQVIGGKQITPETLMNQVKQVTKEDVIKVANKMEEDTIYLLTNKGGSNNE